MSREIFSRHEVKWVLFRMLVHVYNHLSGVAELHRIKANRGFGTECLMEYSPRQPPLFTVSEESKVTIMSKAGRIFSHQSIDFRVAFQEVLMPRKVTHRITVAMKGRSEYTCDRFSSRSAATEGVFRIPTSESRSWTCIISPRNIRYYASWLSTVLTILGVPFHAC